MTGLISGQKSVKDRLTVETARDELLKLQQLRTLVCDDWRRGSVVDCLSDSIRSFGLFHVN